MLVKALVLAIIEEYDEAEDPDLCVTPDTMLVLQYAGPRGYPGMPGGGQPDHPAQASGAGRRGHGACAGEPSGSQLPRTMRTSADGRIFVSTTCCRPSRAVTWTSCRAARARGWHGGRTEEVTESSAV